MNSPQEQQNPAGGPGFAGKLENDKCNLPMPRAMGRVKGNPDSLTGQLGEALAYARKGWRVFPCGRDKKPLTTTGFKAATMDQEQITAWWSRWPDASIGCPTGPAMGAWVLDVDQPDGPATLADLETKHGSLPATLEQRTGGGGRHLFFQWPSGREVGCSARKLGPGLDVRGAGGYVILPPSGHPSGGRYAWTSNGAPLAEAPAWLLDLVCPSPKPEAPRPQPQTSTHHAGATPYGKAALDAEAQKVAGADHGGRNHILNQAAFAAGQLVAGGEIDQTEAESALLDAAITCGLTEGEARKTLESGMRAGMKEPRSAPEKPHKAEAREADPEVVEAPGLVVVDAAQFLALDIPPREHVLAPIIPTQGLAMLYAPRGVGKTFMAMTMTYAAASGQRVLRWQAPEPRPVLYIDGEMPAVSMRERLAQIAAGFDREPPDGFLRIVTPDLQPDFMPNLATPEGQARIASILDGTALVVVDNIATLARHGRENETEGWLPVQAWILDLRRRGISVLLVHHANKSGGQRGTSAREDVLDTVISLRRPADYRPDEGARFEVHLEKARGIIGPDAKPFEATLTQEGPGLVWQTRDIEDVEAEQVARLHAEGNTVRDIAEETGISKSTVQRIIKRIKGAA